MRPSKTANMRCYSVIAIPHNTDVLPYVVGVYSSIDIAEEMAEIERTVTEDILIDINEHSMNKIDGSKYMLYEELKGRE